MNLSNNEKDEDWISVSDMARLRGVSQPAISKRLRTLAARGFSIPSRVVGKFRQIHAPTFDNVVQITHNPAQDLRNRGLRPEPPEQQRRAVASAMTDNADETADFAASPRLAGGPKFGDAAAREKNAKAQLAEMQLAQKRGELVPAREIEAAAIAAATSITQRLNAMKAAAGKLYAASKGGEEAMQIELIALVDNMAKAIAEDMAALAEKGADITANPFSH